MQEAVLAALRQGVDDVGRLDAWLYWPERQRPNSPASSEPGSGSRSRDGSWAAASHLIGTAWPGIATSAKTPWITGSSLQRCSASSRLHPVVADRLGAIAKALIGSHL